MKNIVYGIMATMFLCLHSVSLLAVSIAADPNGNAAMIWIDENQAVQASIIPIESSDALLTQPQQLSRKSEVVSRPQIAISTQGDAIATWVNESYSSPFIEYRAYNASSHTWGEIGLVPTPSFDKLLNQQVVVKEPNRVQFVYETYENNAALSHLTGATIDNTTLQLLPDSLPNLGAACAHDPCVTGGPLDPTCDPCVAKVCNLFPECCQTHWYGACVELVDACGGPTCCASLPNGSPCGSFDCTQSCQGGVCTLANATSGTSCDNNICYLGNTCDGHGNCINGTPNVGMDCGMSFDCTEHCDANGKCVAGPPTDGTVCFSMNPCTFNVCQSGMCVPTGPNNGGPCGMFNCSMSCTGGMCVVVPETNGSFCLDGGYFGGCTIIDTCQAGICVPGPAVVNGVMCNTMNSSCTMSCQNGVCTNTPASNGIPCSTGNACTLQDSCQSGVCTSGPPAMNGILCGPNDCTQSCQNGMCANVAANNGVSCGPNDCSKSCQNGACAPVTASNGVPCGFNCNQTCQAGACTAVHETCSTNSCVYSVCTQNTICSNPITQPNSTPCSLPGCTSVATCQSGMCICTSSGGPTPPSGLVGVRIENEFLTQIDYVSHLTWQPSSDPSVVKYYVFRNGTLIATIPASGPFVYNDHNRRKNKADVYSVVAVNGSGVQSTSISVTVP